MSGLELASPRVKNAPVKAYFALAYYVMLYTAIQEAIDEVQDQDEKSRRSEVKDYLYTAEPSVSGGA